MQPCPNEAILSAFITTHHGAVIMPNRRSVLRLFHRAIAQLVEQRSPKPQVGGSSPSRPARHHMGRWHSGNCS
jgi:hypothetical protein